MNTDHDNNESEKIGNVCFISHFHQPYWQPNKIWNKVKKNSYLPWLDLLTEMVNYKDFYINIHFSGPFLIQMFQDDKSYIQSTKDLLTTSHINPISGFIDEGFVQLSSRPDDIFFQLEEYLKFAQNVFGLKHNDFCGIHIVEREVNERLIYKISDASKKLELTPLMYLDAESFYDSQSVFPGDSKDLYYKFFNQKDLMHITSTPILPNNGLFFLFRDEVGGNPFYILPIHSKFRYYLLKRKKSNIFEKSITPEDYLKLILKKREEILKFTQKFKTEKEPIISIFTDAERLGQWSGNFQKDKKWLKRLFNLIRMEEDLRLTTLSSYFQEQGFLDTYPIKTSNSYPEFNNWSGNRGIRGLIFADPKLRKVYSQTIQLEQFQEEIEYEIMKKTMKNLLFPVDIKELILKSPERYSIINKLLKSLKNPTLIHLYSTMNRLRNMSYLEDGKWATRHPSFGNQPHLDLMALTCLDIAESLGSRILKLLNCKFDLCKIYFLDWNQNGFEEIILQNLFQKVILRLKGGHIIFHQIRSTLLVSEEEAQLLTSIDSFIKNSIVDKKLEGFSTNICFTEPDSKLKTRFDNQHARIEKCRDSCRVDIYIEKRDRLILIGDFSDISFEVMEQTNSEEISVTLVGKKDFLYKRHKLSFVLTKKYRLNNKLLRVEIKCELNDKPEFVNKIIITPEFVFTLLPSDGINFEPDLSLEIFHILASQSDILYEIGISHYDLYDSTLKYKEVQKKIFKDTKCKSIEILPKIILNKNKVRKPVISMNLCDNCIVNLKRIEILPAISNFYENKLSPESSSLSYHTSGIKIRPYLALTENPKQSYSYTINYDLDEKFKENHNNRHLINLIKIKRNLI